MPEPIEVSDTERSNTGRGRGLLNRLRDRIFRRPNR